MAKSPPVVGHGLYQIDFHGPSGREGLMIALVVFLVSDAVGVGYKDNLAGEAVTVG
jgi:hypothetical protein